MLYIHVYCVQIIYEKKEYSFNYYSSQFLSSLASKHSIGELFFV